MPGGLTPPVAGRARLLEHAAKVWFLRGDQVLSFVRADSHPDRPNLDTFGGKVDPKDVAATQGMRAPSAFVAAARRELGEEVELPGSWLAAAEQEYLAHPRGHHLLELQHPHGGKTAVVAHWFVNLPPQGALWTPPLLADGLLEVMTSTLAWRLSLIHI